ncbi:MAG: LysR family transcriptional regulator, partial [Eggerthellaceae bacterium]|nr:LysR family transcriptional regulator [Eggerthellaceae bacterium]
MHIELLKEYVELAQCLNFTEAARRCCITQSALSKHLVTLENEIGTQLIERDRHSVKLTSAGHILLQEAVIINEHWDNVKKRIIKEGALPPLRIGGLLQNPRVLWIISSVLSSNDDSDIGITCTYNQSYSKPFDEQLLKNEIDLSFTYLSEDQKDDFRHFFEFRFIFEDPFIAVVSTNNPLAKYDRLSMEDLA